MKKIYTFFIALSAMVGVCTAQKRLYIGTNSKDQLVIGEMLFRGTKESLDNFFVDSELQDHSFRKCEVSFPMSSTLYLSTQKTGKTNEYKLLVQNKERLWVLVDAFPGVSAVVAMEHIGNTILIRMRCDAQGETTIFYTKKEEIFGRKEHWVKGV